MAERVFIQRSRLGRTILVLRDEEIEVTVGKPGEQQTQTFPLRTISTDYTVKGLHFTAGVIALFIVSIATVALGVYLSRLGEPFRLLAMNAAIFAGAFALAGVRMIPRFDFFTFSDHWKRPLFSIARERDQVEECDTFVSDLLARIERASTPANSAAPEPPPEFGEVVDAEPEWKWMVSVVVGAATLAVTIAGGYDPDIASIAFFGVMGGPMCVAVSAWLSFVEKERRWRWSLLGVVLVLVAVALALQT